MMDQFWLVLLTMICLQDIEAVLHAHRDTERWPSYSPYTRAAPRHTTIAISIASTHRRGIDSHTLCFLRLHL